MNINYSKLVKRLTVVVAAFLVVGCAGVNTFNKYAKSGETVAIPIGWKPDWARDNINVVVFPSNGGSITYPPNDPSIRAVVNFYPDPLSSMVVSNRTGQDITTSAKSYGDLTSANFTSGSLDWFQTVVFFDLPDPLALGETFVSVEEAANTNNFVDTKLMIIDTGGSPHDFEAALAGTLTRQHLAALERSSHYVVELTGTGDVPHAVQLDFTHDTGVGTAYVVEPISGVKNLTWTDDGTNLRVIIMPADEENTLTSFQDFRFYVAGGVTNLTPSSAPQAFDINGGDVTGVAPPIVTTRSIVIDDTNI